MSKSMSLTTVLVVGALFLVATEAANACTGIRLIAGDGTVIHARTLEFGMDLHSEVIVVPRGFKRVGTTPDGKPGMTLTTKYASAGTNGMGLPVIFDGLNEKGLSVGLFYFPGTAGYMPYNAADAGKTIAAWELGSWILENCATAAETKEAIQGIVVPDIVFAAMGFSPGIHFIVTDASGKSITIEYLDGKLNVFDNPLGILTNSPSFDWHMTNLQNYVNLTADNALPASLGSVKLTPLGQGSGMLGLPGDFTPPSRFVRAAMYSQSVFPVKTGRQALLQAFHILNNFDIPKGVARESGGGHDGADYTMWTSASDLKAKVFYFRTHDSSQIRSVDLMKMPIDGKEIAKISMQGDEQIEALAP
ncbi:linear amide C-N hydrolase [Aeoliella sp. SH292]|uniref:linear amide C-N hydrolase n=1 Tax=Aeoliella sp. SH292 TaxID=3454464 RepID=UPI003F9B3EA6